MKLDTLMETKSNFLCVSECLFMRVEGVLKGTQRGKEKVGLGSFGEVW